MVNPDSVKNCLCRRGRVCFADAMAGELLSPLDRAHFLVMIRRHLNSAVHRRMNALLLLDDGWMVERVADRRACARLSAVAPAGRSMASYATGWDTTAPPLARGAKIQGHSQLPIARAIDEPGPCWSN